MSKKVSSWRIGNVLSPKDYIEKLLVDVDGRQRETTEEARLIDLLLDGRLEDLIRLALEEISIAAAGPPNAP